jgi:integrase/recombinase XerD
MKTEDETNTPRDADTLSAIEMEIARELEPELGERAWLAPVRQLPAVPSVPEVRRLLDCAKGYPDDYLILRLFYYTGMRVGELSNARYADVSFDDETIFVRGGKGNQDRYVCVDPRTLELVQSLRGDRKLSDRIVPKNTRQLNLIMDEYGKRAGLVQKYEAMSRSFSPHSLRHAFATHRYNAGMDLAVLQKLLGHRFLATTLIYVHTGIHQEQKQYRKTDPLRERAKRGKA